MPFTPLHLGPALFLGLIFWDYLDFPTFLIASILVDARAILVFFGLMNGPIHGFLHSFAGATVVAIPLMIGAVAVRNNQTINGGLKLMLKPQNSTKLSIALAGLTGTYLHVLLDAIIYTDVSPLAPFSTANPFYGLMSVGAVFGFCAVSFFLGLIYYLYIMVQQELRS